MREEIDRPDGLVARIAARQHGVVTFAQLIGAGLSRGGIDRRVRAGRVFRVFRGVYAVGHPGLTNEGWWMAAVLACGEGAVLSHRSAAELWALLPARTTPVHVTIPRASGHARRSLIRLHRSRSLPPAATTIHNHIPVTTPERTLRDLTRVAAPGLVRRATRQAEYLDLNLGPITTDRTRSDLERAFLRLCSRYHIREPEVNVSVGPYTVDFLWGDGRLVVETDAYATHRGRQAFEDDRNRELYLHAHGYRLRRFTDTQVYGEPAAVAAAVRDALRA